MMSSISGIISLGRLLADPNRLKIIKLLLTQPMCVCELMEVLALNQSCVSQHLAILKYHQFLKARREGKWIVYEIRRKTLDDSLKTIQRFFKSSLSRTHGFQKEQRRLMNLEQRGLLCRRRRCK